MPNPSVQQQQAMRARLTTTVNSQGWPECKRIAEQVLANMDRHAIDEEDEVKGSQLRREAKAARKFANAYFSGIEQFQQFTGDGEPEADFGDLDLDFADLTRLENTLAVLDAQL